MTTEDHNAAASEKSPSAELDAPVILVGSLRSGTTLLNLMLDHHPRVSFAGEFEAAVMQMTAPGWPDLEAYYRYLETDRMFNSWEGEPLRIDESLSYPELVRDLFRQMHTGKEADVRGVVIHSHFDRCPEIWPNARYVHLVRDGRDVARSCVQMGWAGNVYHAVTIWLEAEARWERLCSITRPEQRIEVRHEDLVRDPKAALTRICEFLGVPYDAHMLSYSEDTTYSAPDVSLLQQWKRKLTPREVRQVELRAGDLLVRRGYELSGHPLPEMGRLEHLWCKADHRLNRMRTSIHRYGLPLWSAHQLTRFGPHVIRRHVRAKMNEVELRHLK